MNHKPPLANPLLIFRRTPQKILLLLLLHVSFLRLRISSPLVLVIHSLFICGLLVLLGAEFGIRCCGVALFFV